MFFPLVCLSLCLRLLLVLGDPSERMSIIDGSILLLGLLNHELVKLRGHLGKSLSNREQLLASLVAALSLLLTAIVFFLVFDLAQEGHKEHFLGKLVFFGIENALKQADLVDSLRVPIRIDIFHNMTMNRAC